MAIGTLAAVALGAGALGSAALSSSAAGKAADASAQAANQSAAVQKEIYGQNKTMLSPWVSQGQTATNTINALLGLGGGTAGTPATASGPDYAAYVAANPDLQAEFQKVSGMFGGDPAAYGQFHWNTYGQNEGRTLPTSGGTAGTPGTSAQDAANNAFDIFRKSTGYDFRVKQGMNALNSGYAGAGTIKSGAAIKGAVDYGQGMASQEFGNYLNALGNQQGVGLSAGSALAGVGTNYANSLGQIYQQNGENQANAALSKANSINTTLNGLMSGIFKYGVK